MRRLHSAASQGKFSPSSLIFTSAMAVILLGTSLWSAKAFGVSFERACTAASTNHATCYALLDKTEKGVETYTAGSGELGGFSPTDLRSAYKLPGTGGSEQTVAVVDAYNDPNAESDLAAYRTHYGLSECSKTGGCFKKLNQKGEEGSLPENAVGWSQEISVDLDMVSAACAGCHIMLVEAKNNEIKELAAATNEAAKLGATEISNSYGLPEEYDSEGKGFVSYDSDYSHAGIPTVVASGDAGYENWEVLAKTPSFPATSPAVIAVGGTTLLPSEGGGRGWAETVWTNSDSGCSHTQSKPPWQTDTGCPNRMDNDVAAVADTSTPVSVYDSYGLPEKWHNYGGTSVSAPLIAGADALNSSYARSLGADAYYLGASSLNDIKSGTDYPVEGSCTPLYFCTAETSYDGPSGNGTPNGLLVLPHWSVQSTPNPTEAKTNVLRGTSCTSSTVCTAVGSYTNSTGIQLTLAERWNGTSWSVQSTPNPAGAKASSLEAVACTSASACTAVGGYTNSSGTQLSLAERWNGTEWSIQSTPNPSGAKATAFEGGVSCLSSTECVAVGTYTNSTGTELTLAERWNGTEWSIQSTPNPLEGKEVHLKAVSCTSSSACIAVGKYSLGSILEKGSLKTLIERWNGTEWSIQTVPTAEASLNGVSCTSSTACTAVGKHEKFSSGPLAERWNGSEWSIQSTPFLTGGEGLHGVSCASSTACTAVSGTLVEYWNGTEWTIQSAAEPTGEGFSLYGVACTAPTACTAVGTYTLKGEIPKPQDTLAEVYQ